MTYYALVIVYILGGKQIIVSGAPLFDSKMECEQHQRELTNIAQQLHPEYVAVGACVHAYSNSRRS